MSRDYKPVHAKPSSTRKGSSFLSGLLLGLLLGVGISAAVAIFITGGESPFLQKPAPETEEVPADALAVLQENKEEKTRFDFYTILPGTESQVTEQEIREKESQASPEAKVEETYFLQVGAFQTEQEADNMKAQLALLGIEAIVQTATIPDKGVWHRVRVGPFTELGQINKFREDLVRNGFTADLIKVNSGTKDQ